jgi:hypothetical protein
VKRSLVVLGLFLFTYFSINALGLAQTTSAPVQRFPKLLLIDSESSELYKACEVAARQRGEDPNLLTGQLAVATRAVDATGQRLVSEVWLFCLRDDSVETIDYLWPRSTWTTTLLFSGRAILSPDGRELNVVVPSSAESSLLSRRFHNAKILRVTVRDQEELSWFRSYWDHESKVSVELVDGRGTLGVRWSCPEALSKGVVLPPD